MLKCLVVDRMVLLLPREFIRLLRWHWNVWGEPKTILQKLYCCPKSFCRHFVTKCISSGTRVWQSAFM